jgi:hypothetical protein
LKVSAMTATSAAAGDGTGALDELTSELELIRQSLHEVEKATRRDLA